MTTLTAGVFGQAPHPAVAKSTEAGDAEHFARLVDGRFVYDHQRRQWFVFGDHHWGADRTGRVVQEAIESMRRRQADALQIVHDEDRKKSMQWALRGESEARIRHMLDLASSHPNLAIEGTEWDHDPWALGVANGKIDLRTAELHPGQPDDRVTRVAAVPYDPEASCPRWDRFILDICNEDTHLVAFLQQSIGYALTGVTTEQVFWILYGVGANGKSTFLETITRHVLPDHSWTMSFPVHTWSESLSEYQRAELVGRRLVIAKESEQEKRLNTEFVKSLTGSDTINARHPYGRPFQFVPAAKFMLACNHQPIIRDDTHGMWRRVRLVPFTRTFAVDPDYGDALAAEAGGILAWAVRGCLAWQQAGLQPPTAVLQATKAYQRDSDTLARFIEARCLVSSHVRARAGELFSAYEHWCDAERIGDDRLSLRAFGERMKSAYPPLPRQRRVTYAGIGLRAEEDECGGCR